MRSRKFLFLTVLLCISLLVFDALRRRGKSEASLIDVISFFGGAFFHQKNMTLHEGENWYSMNKEKLIRLHSLILKHPKIRRVDPGMSLQYVPNSSEFTPEDLSAYKTLEETCKSMNIKNIAVFRKFRSITGCLISVRYTLSSSGLCGGGRMISIEYIVDDTVISRFRSDSEHIVTPLDETNWYVVDYQEGRK